MSEILALFDSEAAAVEAGRLLRARGCLLRDALSPYPVPELAALAGTPPAGLRWPMAFCGFGAAALAYWLQWWSAVHAYPIDSGGRPLHSWPVFLLVPFEVGILAAGLAGCVAFLLRCRLPRLHHPLFDLPGTERLSQDRFALLIAPPPRTSPAALADLLFACGALSVTETGRGA